MDTEKLLESMNVLFGDNYHFRAARIAKQTDEDRQLEKTIRDMTERLQNLKEKHDRSEQFMDAYMPAMCNISAYYAELEALLGTRYLDILFSDEMKRDEIVDELVAKPELFGDLTKEWLRTVLGERRSKYIYPSKYLKLLLQSKRNQLSQDMDALAAERFDAMDGYIIRRAQWDTDLAGDTKLGESKKSFMQACADFSKSSDGMATIDTDERLNTYNKYILPYPVITRFKDAGIAAKAMEGFTQYRDGIARTNRTGHGQSATLVVGLSCDPAEEDSATQWQFSPHKSGVVLSPEIFIPQSAGRSGTKYWLFNRELLVAFLQSVKDSTARVYA